MGKPENTFPTIRDLHEVLTGLLASGYGELPIQIVVAPDSTLQVLGGGPKAGKPALMIEWPMITGRQPVAFISTARLGGNGQMPTLANQ